MLSTISLCFASSRTEPTSRKPASWARAAVASLRPSLAQSTSPCTAAPTSAPISPGKRSPTDLTSPHPRSSQRAEKVNASAQAPRPPGISKSEDMADKKKRETSEPPGHFVSDDHRAQTESFLHELRMRIMRKTAEAEPKLGPPRRPR